MAQFRNFKMVSYVVYGRGSFNQLDEILAPQRKNGAPVIFLIDHFFQNKPLPGSTVRKCTSRGSWEKNFIYGHTINYTTGAR